MLGFFCYLGFTMLGFWGVRVLGIWFLEIFLGGAWLLKYWVFGMLGFWGVGFLDAGF